MTRNDVPLKTNRGAKIFQTIRWRRWMAADVMAPTNWNRKKKFTMRELFSVSVMYLVFSVPSIAKCFYSRDDIAEKWENPENLVTVSSWCGKWSTHNEQKNISSVYRPVYIISNRSGLVITKAMSFYLCDGKFAPFWESPKRIGRSVKNPWIFKNTDNSQACIWETKSNIELNYLCCVEQHISQYNLEESNTKLPGADVQAQFTLAVIILPAIEHLPSGEWPDQEQRERHSKEDLRRKRVDGD